jgi:citrate synthase
MNALQKVVLTLYTLDEKPDDTSLPNVVRQSMELVARFPTIIAYAYLAVRNKFHSEALFIKPSRTDYDIAENFLYMLRPGGEFTPLESEILDLALVLHAEHGGGNNSTFTSHVVSSTQTDTYSAIAAAIGSLKGPLHGAANANVMDMMRNIKENVKDWADRDEVSAYVEKIVRKEAHNRTGLVYGLGHAVYTKSDPRAIILNQKAQELAEDKDRLDEYNLYNLVADVTPGVFKKVKNSDKVIAPNVDYFSGFVYDMLGFPQEIYTPLFAMARITGWSAHRIDELINGGRIIRPGYKSVAEPQKYIPLDQRK